MPTYSPEAAQLGWAAPPGRLLQRELDARGVTQAQLASRTGLSAKHVNLVIKGHAAISPEVAVSLEQILETPAEFWLTLEAGYQAQAARAQRHESLAGFADWAQNFPRDLLVEHGVVRTTDAVEDVVGKLLSFFEVATPAAFRKTWLEPQASYKRSQLHAIDPYLTALWMRVAEVKAGALLQEAPTHDAARLRTVAGEIPRLTLEDVGAGFHQAQQLLLSAGTALVFVPEINRTRICGVSRWMGGQPLIAVTSRYKTFDSFWFTLLHEIGHVLLHPKRSTYVDFLGKANDDQDALESAANEFAEQTLIPSRYRPAVVAADTPAAIMRIAQDLGVSPGVVAGQRAFLTGIWGGPIARLRNHGDLAEFVV